MNTFLPKKTGGLKILEMSVPQEAGGKENRRRFPCSEKNKPEDRFHSRSGAGLSFTDLADPLHLSRQSRWRRTAVHRPALLTAASQACLVRFAPVKSASTNSAASGWLREAPLECFCADGRTDWFVQGFTHSITRFEICPAPALRSRCRSQVCVIEDGPGRYTTEICSRYAPWMTPVGWPCSGSPRPGMPRSGE